MATGEPPRKRLKTGKKKKKRVYDLQEYEELRFEVTSGQEVIVKVLEGTAEIFGTELAREKEYRLRDSHVAIFTFHGCRVSLTGETQDSYTSMDTPMVTYLNTHACLENMRKAAQQIIDKQQLDREDPDHRHVEFDDVKKLFSEWVDTVGPRVLIVGAKDCGKSSLARMLLTYAVRGGRKPDFVDLDVGLNSIAIPGAVAAVSVEQPVDIETGLKASSPTSYFYGHLAPQKKWELYKKCVTNLARDVKKRWTRNLDARIAGCIIDTYQFWGEKAKETIVHIAEEFQANVILVVDHERLHSYLSKDRSLSKRNVSVIPLKKSGGVVQRDEKYRAAARKAAIHRYFYGPGRELHPYQQVLGYHEVKICQVGRGSQAPVQSLLPIGSESRLDPNMVRPVRPNQNMKHAILALSYATTQKECIDANVAGFLHLTQVDHTRLTITALTPCPGPMPGAYLIIGNITWID